MIEVEVKLPIESRDIMEERLLDRGFEYRGTVKEEDYYYDNEAQQIRKGGEALRIRRITNMKDLSVHSVITFKGKKLDSVSMTRRELETGVEDGETASGILECLGFHPVNPAVIKERKEYTLGNMNACLDRVEGLGDFLELEIVTGEEIGRNRVLLKVEDMLIRLGHSMSDTVRTSYLSMLQKTID